MSSAATPSAPGFPPATRSDVAVNNRLLVHLDMLVATLAPRRGARRVGDTVLFGADEALELRVEGPAAGTWYDRRDGSSGGLLGLVGKIYGANRDEAIIWSIVFLSEDVANLAPPAPQELGCEGEA